MNEFTGMTGKNNVGPGWQPLLEEAISYLDEHIPGWQIIQIKEKFAGLRFYWDALGDPDPQVLEDARKFVYDLEEKSLTMCEECGEPAAPEHRGDSYWWKTLCEKHWAEQVNR
jgi:hypothetical protein